MARFGQALKASKAPQQLWKASAPHNPPLALPSYLPIGPSNCFYWASKLLHSTFWPGLKSPKSPAAAFESLSTAQPSACFAIVPPHRPYTNCFYWASKLLHGTFWAGLKTFTSPAAAFESLSTAQPSACFAIVPPHRPYKLFLLGFEAATWHVLARPRKLQKPRSSFRKPQHRTTLRLLCHRTSPEAPQTVSIGLRNCYMARFGQALKPQKPRSSFRKPQHRTTLRLLCHRTSP